jgi:2-polyprenyl-3-methyl-5-hydroxy-6-metoxy-1,4-benzoquinol methylase
MACRICSNMENNISYDVREMMFGSKEIFRYVECNHCGCLQIKDIPNNLFHHYPLDYYSFDVIDEAFFNKFPKKIFKNLRNNYSIFKNNFLGQIINYLYPDQTYNFLNEIKLTRESSILDLGCGNGQFLYNLKMLGFHNVLGIDPYLKEDIRYKNGLSILKKSIFQIKKKWDLIILNHSFEHLPNPLQTIEKIALLLNKNGVCIIRTPTVDSDSWRFYKENWVQLDAPRHLFLYSLKSLNLIFNTYKLRISKIIHDSTDFQFWGSEQYSKDISLHSKVSYLTDPQASIFDDQQIKKFKKRANDLNKNKRGDQAVYFITKQ